MTDIGGYLEVDSSEVAKELVAILKAVEEQHRKVRILRDGKAIAEVSPATVARPLAGDPDLKVVFSDQFDPTEGLSDGDWPAQSR